MTESTPPASNNTKRQAPPSRNLLDLPSVAGVNCLTLPFLASVVVPSVGPVVQDPLQTPVDESCRDYWYNEIPSQNTSQLLSRTMSRKQSRLRQASWAQVFFFSCLDSALRGAPTTPSETAHNQALLSSRQDFSVPGT